MVACPAFESYRSYRFAEYLYSPACWRTRAAGFALFGKVLWSALIFQFLIGAGMAGTYMPGLKTLTDHLEGRRSRARPRSIPPVFGLGSSLSIVASGKIAAVFDWQWASFSAPRPVWPAI